MLTVSLNPSLKLLVGNINVDINIFSKNKNKNTLKNPLYYMEIEINEKVV